MVALNLNAATRPHVDHDDCVGGISAVAPFGLFSGGRFRYDDHDVEVNLIPGDVLFFDSHLLRHSVTEFQGTRNSITLFSHQSLFDYYQI